MRNKQYIASAPVGDDNIYPGLTALPNGEFQPKMDIHFTEAFISIEFYNDLGTIPLNELYQPANLVTPSAGTATITASENGNDYGTLINGTDIDVTTADYPRMNFLGSVSHVKGVTSGIVGASHWRILITRS